MKNRKVTFVFDTEIAKKDVSFYYRHQHAIYAFFASFFAVVIIGKTLIDYHFK